jgi:hypothetical protein
MRVIAVKPIVRFAAVAFSISLATLIFAQAEEYATTDGGRRVLLRDNGTWAEVPATRSPSVTPPGAAAGNSAAKTICDSVTPIKPIDVRKLVAILHTGDFVKREFETTEQFKQRVSGTVSKAQRLIAATTGSDELVLTIPISAEDIEYAADRAEMTGKIPHFGGGVQILDSTDAADLASVNKAYGYGTPAGGGEAQRWYLAFAQHASIASFSPRFSVTVPLNEARQVKGALALLMVGRLKAPYLDHYHQVGRYADVHVTELIHADISCAALYHRGRILLKLDAAKL